MVAHLTYRSIKQVDSGFSYSNTVKTTSRMFKIAELSKSPVEYALKDRILVSEHLLTPCNRNGPLYTLTKQKKQR